MQCAFLQGGVCLETLAVQEHKTKQERTFEDLGKVQEMLMRAGRMEEADSIRQLHAELLTPDDEEPARGEPSAGGKKAVSADQFLTFLQKQAMYVPVH